MYRQRSLMWTLMAYHFHVFSVSVANWLIFALGITAMAVTEAVPGENYLLRAGAAAVAIVALSVLFVRTWRLLARLKDNADEWVEIKRDFPALKKEMKANTAATLATNRTLGEIKRTLDGMTGRETLRDERERDAHG